MSEVKKARMWFAPKDSLISATSLLAVQVDPEKAVLVHEVIDDGSIRVTREMVRRASGVYCAFFKDDIWQELKRMAGEK